MHYLCKCCGATFDRPQTYREHTGVKADGGFQQIIRIDTCPWCHEADFVPIISCRYCGTEYEAGKGCPTCDGEIRKKFRRFVWGLNAWEREKLEEMLDGKSIKEV